MGNYKRTKQWAGRPALLDNLDHEYRNTWLQPVDERSVPVHVCVYDGRDGYVGYRALDPTKHELTWLRSLWKEVPNPMGGSSPYNDLTPVSNEDDEETLEVEAPAPFEER